jgi:hypothetical protein
MISKAEARLAWDPVCGSCNAWVLFSVVKADGCFFRLVFSGERCWGFCGFLSVGSSVVLI